MPMPRMPTSIIGNVAWIPTVTEGDPITRLAVAYDGRMYDVANIDVNLSPVVGDVVVCVAVTGARQWVLADIKS